MRVHFFSGTFIHSFFSLHILDSQDLARLRPQKLREIPCHYLPLRSPLAYLPTYLPTCLPVFHCPYLPPSSPSTSHTGHPIDIELISNDHLPHTFPPTDKPSPQLQ